MDPGARNLRSLLRLDDQPEVDIGSSLGADAQLCSHRVQAEGDAGFTMGDLRGSSSRERGQDATARNPVEIDPRQTETRQGAGAFSGGN